jgi:hypothetical protein
VTKLAGRFLACIERLTQSGRAKQEAEAQARRNMRLAGLTLKERLAAMEPEIHALRTHEGKAP